MAHVAGFTVADDVSARDWQMRRNGKQWLLGKTFDTFCPLGPALVTKDSIAGASLVFVLGADPGVRRKQCSVEGCRCSRVRAHLPGYCTGQVHCFS